MALIRLRVLGLELARRWWASATLTLAVFNVSLGILWHAAHHAPFWLDESDYIQTSYYFVYLFIRHDIHSQVWGDNLWTHTQPMLMRYLVGFWLWFRGIDIMRLGPPWDIQPRWFLLLVRELSVAISACGLVVLFWLGRAFSSTLAAVAAAALVLANPLVRDNLVRAIPEAPLTLLMLASLWLAVVGTRRGRRGALPLGWSLAIGVALGLALQTKLTAVLSIVSVGAWALAVLAAAWWRARDRRGAEREVWSATWGWGLAIVVALVVFVATNPHLYPNPVLHTKHLFEMRQATMQMQASNHPDQNPGNLLNRFSYVIGGSLELPPRPWYDPSPVWHGIPLAVVLAPIGAVALTRRSWRAWKTERRVAIEGMLVLTTVVYVVGVAVPIELEWYRYLVPSYILCSLLAGIGLAALVDELRRLRRLRSTSPAT